MTKNFADNSNYVLIIGSSNMDLNIYSKKLPKPGETVTRGTFRKSLGGKGANQAVGSVRSGASTTFIGKIGMDNFGDQMVRQLSAEGINTDYMIRTTKEHSGVAFIMIDERGENMISVAPGANATLSSQEIEQYQNVIKSANSLVVQMEIPTETIMTIYKIAEKGNVVKILNPAPLKPLPKKLISHLDVIIPNEGELSRLYSLLGFENQSYHSELTTDRIVEMSRDIADLGTRYIITTLGPEGCIVFDHKENKVHKIPSFEVEAVDTVGAGDCFNGVLAGQLCEKKDIIDAAITATCASSIAVSRKGAQASMPNRKEIMERVKKYKSLYQTTVLK